MKILSRMLSKKIDPQAPVDLEQEDDGRAGLDDAGQVRSPRVRSAALSDPIKAREEEPEVAGTGWAQDGDWDDDWDDDEDWGDEEDPALAQERRRQTQDKEHLVSEIREAMTSVTHREPSRQQRPRSEQEISDEELAGRRKLARSQLTPADNETEDRLLEKTEDVMSERETSRRRSAMAHMKAAAAATKADRVLRHVAGRDSTADPEEQSPYREDLAKVVRPHSVGKPVSRPATRPEPVSPTWDRGEGDEDAALFAASEDGMEDDLAASVDQEMSAAEERRISRRPLSMNEDDFADPLPDHKPRAAHDFPSSRFAVPDDEDDQDKSAFDEFEDAAEDISRASRPSDDHEDPFAGTQFASHEEEDDADFEDEEDDFSPRPSRVVTQAVAFANATDDDDISLDEPEPDVRKKIWEMADEVAAEIETAPPPGFQAPGGQEEASAPEAMLDVSGAVAGRAGRSAGRVKTRLLGFQADDEAKDVFAPRADGPAPVVADKFPTGWIIVIDGPGRGASFSLHAGVSNIGRGEDQAVRLDFGDTSISRNNHAAVAFDEEQAKFFLGHGGKSNLVRLNGMPVLSTEEMANGDEIRIGETSLKFVALCGEDFSWTSDGDNGEDA